MESTRGLGNHGDKDIKKCVINTPYCWSYEIDPTLECIVIATEGLWQVLRYDVVVDIVTQVINNNFLEIRNKTLSELVFTSSSYACTKSYSYGTSICS
jgi:serine/threonine protein phosphatase PrpC